MSIELVWKGPLPGVLLPGAQQVWHLCDPEADLVDAPVQTLRLPALHNVNSRYRLLEDAFKTLSIAPSDIALLSPFPSKQYSDYHVYNATCVSSDGFTIYFVDDGQHDVLLLAYGVRNGQLSTFAEIDYNDYFERTFATSPLGPLFAGSDSGVEIFSVGGQRISDSRRTTDATSIAVSASRYAVWSSDDYLVRSFQHSGTEEFSLSGITVDGVMYQFDYRSEHNWPVRALWLDKYDRLWLSGRGVACFSETGQLIKLYSDERLDCWGVDRFIGIDHAGLMWFERQQVYFAYFATEMWEHSLSPALNKGVKRTGLEPTI